VLAILVLRDLQGAGLVEGVLPTLGATILVLRDLREVGLVEGVLRALVPTILALHRRRGFRGFVRVTRGGRRRVNL
jgi:hypothetical protein